MSNVAAAVLWIGVVAYAVFAGADFGAGFWDLVAGDATRGARPRDLIDHAITPVWEANHVWLVFCLVMLWTAFTSAFVAVMRELALPLWVAAIGIVLRGAGFAFRKVATRTAYRRVYGAAFAASSVITPFAMGTVAGAIASGRVTVAPHAPFAFPWWNPTSIMGGVLAVATCAYLSAVYLVADSKRLGEQDLAAYFTRRAVVAAVAAGMTEFAGIFVLAVDAHHLFERLDGRALPIVIVSAVAGLGALWSLRSDRVSRAPRVLATVAVGGIVAAWGVAQFPELLPGQLTIHQAASPAVTMAWLVGVAATAIVIVVPAFAFLYVLDQRSMLES